MLNKIILAGRLTRDTELRHTPNGVAVATSAIAVDRDFVNPETQRRDTDFFEIVAWRNTAEFFYKYFQKGTLAIISGRLQTRKYTDKGGNNRIAYEIVADNVYFGESKKTSGALDVSAFEEATDDDGSLPF